MIRDHKVQGHTILPGVAYLDAALTACGVSSISNTTRCRLSRVVWSHPLQVDADEKSLSIELTQRDGLIVYTMHSGLPSDDAPHSAPHSQGQVQLNPIFQDDEVSFTVPLAAIRARCKESLDKPAIYRRFERMGIDYGPYFQGLEGIIFNADEALGMLQLPVEPLAAPTTGPLHPTLMDGAFQTALLLGTKGDVTALPFAMDELILHRPLTTCCLVHVTKSGENCFQIALCDENGLLCVTIKNLVMREKKDALQSFFYLPRWKACGSSDAVSVPTLAIAPTTGAIVLVGGEHTLQLTAALSERHRHDRVLKLTTGQDMADPAQLDRQIAALEKIERIYFLGGIRPTPSALVDMAELEQAEQTGVLSLFRLIQSLHRCGYARQALEMKVITNDLHAITTQQETIPYSASLVGLAKVVAKEFPKFKLTSIDLCGAQLAACQCAVDWDKMITQILAEPENHGEEIVLRDGLRYTRTLEAMSLPSGGAVPFRHGGTYLILGGSGGLGYTFSQHLASKWQARLIWLGRSAENDSIRQKIAHIKALGGELLYLQADATDAPSMAAAVAMAKARFGPIEGAVHSAIVLEDKLITNLDEAGFRRAMEIKTKGSVALFQALQEEPLDFLMFFSSINSFQASMGQSNYVAGCHFKDAFGRYLNSLPGGRLGERVKIINWGFWGSVGIVADAEYRTRLAAQGHVSIEPAEGIEAILRITAQSLPQMLAMRTDTERQRAIGVAPDTRVTLYRSAIPAVLGQIPDAAIAPVIREAAVQRFQSAYEQLERLGHAMLVNAFQQMAVFKQPNEQYNRLSLRAALQVAPVYFPLFDALLRMLRDCAVIRFDGEVIETSERLHEAEFQSEFQFDPETLTLRCTQLAEAWPEIADRLPLLLACYRNWPAVLAGRMNHMEVMFPKGELSLVEGIYKGNEITDCFNLAMAGQVRRYIELRLAENPKANLRILEVGAGTGATSRHVLEAIAPFGNQVSYTFTDVSLKFIREAERKYGERYRFAQFRLFNFEHDPASQGLEPDSMDLVLGTNCIHATQNISDTLLRIKSLLRKHGVLLVNEFTSRLDYNTLTFGLTSGWWSFVDPEWRIQGSPLLAPNRWQQVLASCGFHGVRFGAPAAGELGKSGTVGQQLIVCESDGIVTLAVPPAAVVLACTDNRPAVAVAATSAATATATAVTAVPVATTDISQKQASDYVKRVFAGVIKMPQAEIEDDRTFDNFGVDSLLSLAIIDRFEKDFGQLSSTLLFEYMTVAELSAYFIANHSESLAKITGHSVSHLATLVVPTLGSTKPNLTPPAPSAHPAPQSMPSRPCVGDIAIIGLAGRYPGAPDLTQLYKNLRSGKNSVGEIPPDRWDWRAVRDPAKPDGGGRWGGFITDIDKFDSLFFNISPREAERIDPQERVFLETVWQTIEHAGYTPHRLREIQRERGAGIGVFVGSMYQQYHLLAGDEVTRSTLSGLSYWSIANRISYYFDFHGPSMALDTACSSSLTAIHMACESIRSGESTMAVAGGVNLNLHPGKYLNLRQAGMLGSTSESRSLGDGDGLIPAEGVGAVLLKPLAQALADRDIVLGVIKSTFINHGGRTGGYTVPNPNAQADLIGAALERAGIHPETIGYVEVASNGSALGDPVEIAGLCKAFQRYTDKTGFCAIGAVKSNLGHPEAASGMAQLSKTLLQMQSRTLFPSLHAEPLNPNLRLANTPFYVQKTLTEWAIPPVAPFARRAAISSFGAGGSNAHLIVEEFTADAAGAAGAAGATNTATPQIIVLSAKTNERLAERVRDLLAFLRAGSPQGLPNLADIAYTLQTGREAMKARLAFIATDHHDLLHNLESNCAQTTLERDNSPLPLLLDGEEGRAYLATVLAARKYEKIAQLWRIGADIDWEAMHTSADAAQMPRRCHLPGYPFARIRHWVAQEQCTREPVPAVNKITTPAPLAQTTPQARPTQAAPPVRGQTGVQTAIRQHLKEFIADILRVAVSEIDFDIDMREYGLDSINLAELATRTNACFGLDLTVDLFFGHSSIEKCARFLWDEYSVQIEQWHTRVNGAALAQAEPVSAPVSEPATSGRRIWLPSTGNVANDCPVAIIGMNGFMPQSDDLGQFWEHLISGRELIEDMPEVRKRKMGMSSESMDERIEMPSMRGSFLNRVDAFDSLFFGISPREAALMDPQQRLLLEVMWKTIEDAGYPASELAGNHIGVFVGVSNHDYSKLYQRMRGEAFAHASTGMMVQSILANRVSYLFDLHGPSEIVDAACSSSTVALDRAVRAIRNGECDSALVGGVNVLLDWHGYAVLHKAGILSKNGRVRMFGRDGTGYVRGEGVGAVWLKPLNQAIADRDHVYAVIRGSATSFDGKTYSMTAPNPLAQTQAVRKAFEQAGVNPANVSHIEAQGTGSPFGDPVEVNAFKGAFRSLYQQWGITGESAPHCGIGYLKPQIGHLESASGMAGLFKILLSMQHNVLPGTCNLEDKDMSVSLTGSPFFVDSANRAWEPRITGGGVKPAARCASLHSFGIGGVNAHVVMEEYLGEE